MRYCFRNIVRLPKKTALLFILFALVLLLAMSGKFIIQLCGEFISRSLGPLGGTVIVTNEKGDNFLHYYTALEIAENSDVIDNVHAVAEYPVNCKGLDYFKKSGDIAVYSSSYQARENMGSGSNADLYFSNPETGLKLVATTDMAVCEEIYSGKTEIVEGSIIGRTDNDKKLMKIVISDNLAKLNGLSLGDTVTLNIASLFVVPQRKIATNVEANKDILAGMIDVENAPAYVYSVDLTYEDVVKDLGYDTVYMTFTIGGIVHNNVSNNDTSFYPFEVNDNRVYVPISVLAAKLDSIYNDPDYAEFIQRYVFFNSYILTQANFAQIAYPERMRCLPTNLYFEMSSLSYTDELEAAINEIGFYDTVKLTKFTTEAGTSPAAKILDIVQISLVFIIAAGFVILFLVVLFNLSSRRREFSVLSALGMRRSKTALSFFMEIAVVFVVAFIIVGLIFGFAVRSLAAPISEYLENAEESAHSTEFSASAYVRHDEAKEKRQTVMLDTGYLGENYIMPSVYITAAISAAILLLSIIPIYLYMRKLNPLTDSGGKE